MYIFKLFENNLSCFWTKNDLVSIFLTPKGWTLKILSRVRNSSESQVIIIRMYHLNTISLVSL